MVRRPHPQTPSADPIRRPHPQTPSADPIRRLIFLLMLISFGMRAEAQLYNNLPLMSSSNIGIGFSKGGYSVTWLPVRTDVQQQVEMALNNTDQDTFIPWGNQVVDITQARNWGVSAGSLSGTTWTVPQTAGVFSATCTAYDNATWGPETDDPDVNLTNSLAMQVVNNIAMKNFLTGAELEEHPVDLGGGRKIFPGKLNPTDTQASDRRKVKIEATVSTPMAGVTVYFKIWDVDDPSASTPPLDNDPNEVDNRGSFTWAGVSGDVFSTTTDSTGKATATLLSSYQPGDNCRVTAACYNAGNSLGTWSAVNAGTHPPHGKTTEMLTVWRRLHLEMDSMGAPGSLSEGAHLFDGDSALTGNSTILEGNDLYEMGKDWRPLGQLLGGLLDPNTNDLFEDQFLITSHTVTTMTATTNLNQNGSPTLTSNAKDGDPYSVFLDDPDPMSLTEPPLTVIQDAFAECYITVVRDLTNYESDNVDFVRNASPEYLLGDVWPNERGSRTFESIDYWTAYILIAYEGDINYDEDPEYEEGRGGVCSNKEPEYAAAYMEIIRDAYMNNRWPSLSQSQVYQRVIAHEIGHQFELEHTTDNTIMNALGSGLSFSDLCKDEIRKEPTP